MSFARGHRRFSARLAVVLLMITLPGALIGIGGGGETVHAASFGPQLFLLGPSPLQVEVLPALPATIHAVIEGEGPTLYVASGGPDLLDRAAAGDIPAKLLDADTAGRVYYFIDAQAEGAQDAARSIGSILYADSRQLLLAVPAKSEPMLLETLPAQGISLALLRPDSINLDQASAPASPGARIADGADPRVAALLAQISPQAISDRIADLSGERAADIGGGTATLATRYTFSSSIRNAEAYLYQRYVELGLPVSYAGWSYGSYTGRNVIAEIRGTVHPERIWLAGGHFDDTSEAPYSRAPGADDNASGTAATLVIADVLRQHRFADTIRFVHFSAEEQGHWGSQVYARSLSSAGAQVMGYLDLDMIGWDGNADRTMEIHSGTHANSVDLAARFTSANQRYGQGLRVEVKGSTASRFSDHSSFWDFGYPAFMAIENFFDDAIVRDRNPWYHQTGDLLSRVDPDYTARTARTALAVLAEGAGLDAAPPPTATATPTATSTSAIPPTATATATPVPASCTELVANGGFEANSAWTFAATGNPGGYTAAQAYAGLRSARLGVVAGALSEVAGAAQPLSRRMQSDLQPKPHPSTSAGAPMPASAQDAQISISGATARQRKEAALDKETATPERNLLGELAPLGASYSTAYQTITVPTSARTVTLSFWHRPGTQATAADFQRVLLLKPGSYGLIATVMKTLVNASAWQPVTFDLTPYRGQSLVLYFEVYNDDINAGPRTWMYVDNVSAQACSGAAPTPTSTHTPTSTVAPTGTPTPSATVSPTSTATATATRPAEMPPMTPTATATATSAPQNTQTPTPTATALACSERVANGGFEVSAAWAFASTGNPGGYTTAQAHTGSRSARLGVAPAGFAGVTEDERPSGTALSPGDVPERNLLGELAPAGASYSTAYQTIAVPSGARSTTLKYWYRPGTQATGGDFQRVLLLRPGTYGLLDTLMKSLINANEWQPATFDLSAYRGQSVVLYFEVYNDDIAAGPRTWMFVDDVSVSACSSSANLGASTGMQANLWLPLVMASGR
jgi:hypothetical protein